MKKWLIGIVSLFLLFSLCVSLLIPRKIFVSTLVTARTSQSALYRFLSADSNWQKWWPGSASAKGSSISFELDGYAFKKSKPLYNSFEIAIEKNSTIDSSFLRLFTLNKDSIKIEWNLTIETGLSPFDKIRQYSRAKKLHHDLERILVAMQNYASDVKNLYGLDIRKELVKVEYMVSTKKVFTHYPTTADVYEMIGQLKSYLTREHAKEEDHPMLHINAYDSTNFEAQVAIPIDKKLPDSGTFSSKRMLKNGNILVAEITGGNKMSALAMKQMDLFVTDNQYNNIAIPFYSLVTNRMTEPDSSKWVTKIYCPVM